MPTLASRHHEARPGARPLRRCPARPPGRSCATSPSPRRRSATSATSSPRSSPTRPTSATRPATFLDRYGDRIIQLGTVSAPGAGAAGRLLARVPVPAAGPGRPAAAGRAASSPAARCTSPSRSPATTAGTQRGRDEPVYGAHNGPNCRGPAPPGGPGAGGTGQRRLRLRREPLPRAAAGAIAPVAMGYAGTAEERSLLNPIVAGGHGHAGLPGPRRGRPVCGGRCCAERW